MTAINVNRTDQDIVNRLVVAADSSDDLVIDEVGDQHVKVKSSLKHNLYSWGFKINAEVVVTYQDEVEIEFTPSRRIPINLQVKPEKYMYRWISNLISQDEIDVKIPLGSEDTSSEYNSTKIKEVIPTDQIKSISGKAGSRVGLITKYILNNITEDMNIEFDFEEKNTYIRITGDGVEEIKTDIEEIFGQQVSIRFSQEDGLDIKIPE